MSDRLDKIPSQNDPAPWWDGETKSAKECLINLDEDLEAHEQAADMHFDTGQKTAVSNHIANNDIHIEAGVQTNITNHLTDSEIHLPKTTSAAAIQHRNVLGVLDYQEMYPDGNITDMSKEFNDRSLIHKGYLDKRLIQQNESNTNQIKTFLLPVMLLSDYPIGTVDGKNSYFRFTPGENGRNLYLDALVGYYTNWTSPSQNIFLYEDNGAVFELKETIAVKNSTYKEIGIGRELDKNLTYYLCWDAASSNLTAQAVFRVKVY